MLAPFDLADVDTTIVEAVASGLIAVDRFPVEILPGFWVMSGVIPYEGQVVLAAVDFNSRELSSGPDKAADKPRGTPGGRAHQDPGDLGSLGIARTHDVAGRSEPDHANEEQAR